MPGPGVGAITNLFSATAHMLSEDWLTLSERVEINIYKEAEMNDERYKISSKLVEKKLNEIVGRCRKSSEGWLLDYAAKKEVDLKTYRETHGGT